MMIYPPRSSWPSSPATVTLMLRMSRSNSVSLRFRRLMIFQRFGRPSTEIHRWTIATKTKNITHSDRKAASLSRRIANLYIAESQAFQIFFLQGTEIQQQEEIRSAKFLVQCRRPAYHCTNAKIALDETRQ